MILFITEQPYTFNLSGAAALSSSHLRFLVKKFPKIPIQVVFLNENQDFWKEKPDFDQTNILINPIQVSEIKFKALSFKSLGLFFSKNIDKLIRGIFKFEDKREKKLGDFKDLVVKTQSAQFIWCEHLAPVLYLFHTLPEKYFLDKLIYSHHDFLSKILRARANSPRHLIRTMFVKKLENKIFKKIYSFVVGSLSELNQIKLLVPTAKHSIFLPCFYPPLENNEFKSSGDCVKIYHLGTAGATANKIGLNFFFQKVFPVIEDLPFSLEFLGNVKDYVLNEFPHLQNHPKIIFHGFVLNLEEKIEEGMIHIIPYSGMTGTRTRVAGIARFKPCLLGFKTIQDSYPFLKSGENAILAKNEDDFINQLKTLILDREFRIKISKNIAMDMKKFEDELLKETLI